MRPSLPTARPRPIALSLENSLSTLRSLPSRPRFVLKRFHSNSPEAYQEACMHQIASQVTIGVVAFEAVDMEDGRLGIVMERCQDRNVAQVRSAQGSERSAEVDLLRILMEMMEIVRKLHHAGIAHGNLELGNWLISQRNCLRLTDFGSAVHIAVSDIAAKPLFDPRNSSFQKDILQLGRNLYQLALNRPCRYTEDTPRDLLNADVSKKTQDCGYSEALSSLICALIERSMTLTESIAFAKAALEGT